MSNIDYEAIGRCEHLREQINQAIRMRDMEAGKLSQASRMMSSSPDLVMMVNLSRIETALESLKVHQQELRGLMEEYNEWAEKAGKKPIQTMSNGSY